MIDSVDSSRDLAVEDERAQRDAGNVRSIELATFLRGCREALMPQDVGLPMTRRRRTPGLRREEVAELAEISTSLYTWLEQGRDVTVSKRTIEAIATALRLSSQQRRHLFSLAAPQDVELDETVTPALLRFIGSMRANPVFVLDHAWDIVARNRASIAVFGNESADDLGDTDADDVDSVAARHNFVEHIFLDPKLRENCIDWELLAADIVAIFRYEFAAFTADTRSIAVVENLQARSPLFAAHWEQHLIRSHPRGVRSYRHPTAGILNFEPTSYGVVESTGLRLVVYSPIDDETTARVEALVSAQPSLPKLAGRHGPSRPDVHGCAVT